jgi:glycosyltransferase involved in cell wall biosynthesis
MKLYVLSCCYNEEEILPFYLDYYTNFIKADKIIIYDGGSTDNTPNIVKNYPNVEFIVDNKEKMDERNLRDIRNNGWVKYKDEYDWVIVCDMDEFIYHPNLKELLSKYDSENITIAKVNGYDMVSNDFPTFEKGKFLPSFITKGVHEPKWLNKSAVFNPKKVYINYDYGTHSCSPIGIIKYSENPDVKLLQYKWLSHEYITQKSLKSSQRLSDWNLETGMAFHYKDFSQMNKDTFMNKLNSSIEIINEFKNSIIIDSRIEPIDDLEQLKILQLTVLEEFIKNENDINEVYIENESYENGKTKKLLPYLNKKYKKTGNLYTKEKKKDVYIFSHNYLINNWKEILEEQLNKINISGLYKNSTKLFLFAYGDDEQWNIFKSYISTYDKDNKIEIKRHDNNFYEYYTLQNMWNFCQNTEESYILYIHLKGVWSRHNIQTGDNDEYNPTKAIKNIEALTEWRKCLEYFNIERWYNCIEKLEENYEVVGALYNYNKECPLFTGNFWWTNSNYIKKLEYLQFEKEKEPHDVNLWIRIKCEKWINTIENNFYNLYVPKDLDLYHVVLRPNEYRDDINPLISILTPTYKRYDELKNAINCVLNQSYKNWEMLICSDGYDNKTESLIKEYNLNNIKYFHTQQTNDHGSTQRNYLTEISNGKYIIYLDDDNVIYSNYLQTMVDNFDEKTGMIICRINYDGLNHNLPIDDKIILGKIDTLNFIVDKNYTKFATWNNYIEHDYEVIKICENNILNHNKEIKFIPNILGRHIDKKSKKTNLNLNEIWNCSNNEFHIQQKEYEWKKFLEYTQNNINLNNVLEIGSYSLGSTSSLVEIFENVISVDISKGQFWDDFKLKNDNWDYFIGDSSSSEMLEKIKNLNTKFDLIFIDGDHTYDGVKRDFVIYKEFLNDKGIIAFHDILDTDFHKSHNCNVDLFWNEIKKNYNYKEFIDISDGEDSNICFKTVPRSFWGGIGVLNINKNNRIEELLKERRLPHFDSDDNGVNRLFGLKDMINENLNKNSIVCEIGSFEGKSSELFALLTKKVYCVDPWVLNEQVENIAMSQSENKFDDLTKKYTNIIKIKDYSLNASEKFQDKFFDCVYIDGNHDYESVKQDILCWIPKVKDGGFISGHDYHWEDVRMAVKEIFKDLPLKTQLTTHPFYDEDKKLVNVYSDQSWLVKIDEYRKKEVVIMTAHPNFKTSEDITKLAIQSFGDRDIILSTHCPVSVELQKMVKYFLYDKNNPLIRHDYYDQSWFNTDEYYALIKLHKNDNDLQHALAVYINYYNAVMYAKSLGYKTTICTNFDIIFSTEDLNTIDSKINEMYQTGKKSFFMTSDANEGIHYKTIFFITDVDFFLDNFKYVTNETDYNKLTRYVGSETNCLENFFYQTLKNSDKLLLQQISENDLFPSSRVNVFSNIEYFTILPLRDNDNHFVVWFSSANSIDNRHIGINVLKGRETIFSHTEDLTQNYCFYKEIEFEKGCNYEIICSVHYTDVVNQKIIVVNDEIFSKIKEYGEFWKK